MALRKDFGAERSIAGVFAADVLGLPGLFDVGIFDFGIFDLDTFDVGIFDVGSFDSFCWVGQRPVSRFGSLRV
jgi:hypothetical protein